MFLSIFIQKGILILRNYVRNLLNNKYVLKGGSATDENLEDKGLKKLNCTINEVNERTGQTITESNCNKQYGETKYDDLPCRYQNKYRNLTSKDGRVSDCILIKKK